MESVIYRTFSQSTFGVRGRVECAYSLFLAKFQTKERAGNSSWKYVNESRNTTDCMWEELNLQTYVIASGQWNNTKAFAQYQHYQRSERQSKITWNQVCVLARHKIWRFFFGKTLSTTDIVPACCYEKDLQIFPEKSAPPKFILPLKINWLIFSVVSGVKMKNLHRSEQAHCLVSQLCHTRLWSNMSLFADYFKGRQQGQLFLQVLTSK